jgi:hypothetical protein
VGLSGHYASPALRGSVVVLAITVRNQANDRNGYVA